MKKLCFFDTLCLLALVSLLFTIGLHLGKDKDTDKDEKAMISVEVIKFKAAESTPKVRIDGKYECEISSFDGETLNLVCRGEYREAGFLACGAKYLSKNQPIEIVGDAYFFGRIRAIERAE